MVLLTSPVAPAEFLPGLALATAVGLLIGAERGWRMRDDEPGTRVAGIRTFAILGMLGGLVGIASSLGLAMVALIVGLAAVATLVIGYFTEMRTEAHLSATSTIAATATILLGTLATSGQMALAAVGAGIMVALLASREALHGALGQTSQAEMTALIRLGLVVFLVLPLLPDAVVGPYGGINPRRVWFVVVVVGAISFAGYVLVRWLGGRRGTLLMALVGALVSSTAITIEAGRRIRESGASAVEHAAISIASAVMLGRVVVLTLALAPSVVREVVVLLLPAIAISLALSGWQIRRAFDPQDDRQSAIRPPSLGLAVVFAGLVAVLSLGVRWAEHSYGSGSGALVIALGGMVDVDSAIAAVGAVPAGTLPANLAALAIAFSVILNTVLKMGMLCSITGIREAVRAGASLGLVACAILLSAVPGLS